jgi:hypothetical protein
MQQPTFKIDEIIRDKIDNRVLPGAEIVLIMRSLSPHSSVSGVYYGFVTQKGCESSGTVGFWLIQLQKTNRGYELLELKKGLSENTYLSWASQEELENHTTRDTLQTQEQIIKLEIGL